MPSIQQFLNSILALLTGGQAADGSARVSVVSHSLAVKTSDIAPISLSGKSSGFIALPADRVITLQMYSPSDPTRELLFRITDSPDAAVTTSANMSGFLSHGGSDERRTPAATMLYWAWALRAGNGDAVLGGANDVVCVTVEGY